MSLEAEGVAVKEGVEVVVAAAAAPPPLPHGPSVVESTPPRSDECEKKIQVEDEVVRPLREKPSRDFFDNTDVTIREEEAESKQQARALHLKGPPPPLPLEACGGYEDKTNYDKYNVRRDGYFFENEVKLDGETIFTIPLEEELLEGQEDRPKRKSRWGDRP